MTEPENPLSHSPAQRLEAVAQPLVDAKNTIGIAVGMAYQGET